MVEFVNVPVPGHLVTDVMRFIAERSAAGQSGVGVETEPAHGLPDVEWTGQDLLRLRGTNVKTTRTVSALLDALAAAPDTWLTTSELEERTGINRREIKGALSALTRHVRTHYGRGNWPMAYAWGGNLPAHAPMEGHYKVSADLAATWQALPR